MGSIIKDRSLDAGLSEPLSIIVDRQSQFNKSQRDLQAIYAELKLQGVKHQNGLGLPEIDFINFPTIPMSVMSSDKSVGLELVDIYLWIFKRFKEKKELSSSLINFINEIFEDTRYSEISLENINRTTEKIFNEMPEVTDEEMKQGKKILQKDEQRRIKVVNEIIAGCQRSVVK